MPLAVCATPIGNLDDVTLRVLDELRPPTSSSPRTHGTHAVCSSATGSRRVCSPTTSTTRPRASPSCCRGWRRASGSRSSPMPDCPRSPIPARASSGPRATRESSHCPARALSRRDRARRERAGRRPLSLPRLPPAPRGRAGRALARARDLAVAGGRVRVAAAAREDAPVARGRRPGAGGRCLPRADEAFRRGRHRSCRRARGAVHRPRQGRGDARASARRRDERDPTAARAAVADLVAAGTPRRVAADVVARLTDIARNDLYRGHSVTTL